MHNIYKPKNYFYLQWHITEACNLSCKHCYQENYGVDNEFDFIEAVQVFNQYKDLIEFFNEDAKTEDDLVLASLSFTGGEPFKSPYFMDLLEIACSHIPNIGISILSNGTMITKDIAMRLKGLGVDNFQVSIDGFEESHDEIRGKGSFEKAKRGIEFLRDVGINVKLSFTAHKQNFREFPKVVKFGRDLGVFLVWSDRLIATGQGKNLLELSKEETKEYVMMMKDCQDNIGICNTHVGLMRGLQFLATGEEPYSCSAGDNMLTVMPNGDVYPCRRLPILVGNLRETTLKNIYYNNEIVKSLRNPSPIIRGCEDCVYHKSCKGGLRCLAYAKYGELDIADPGCWRTSS